VGWREKEEQEGAPCGGGLTSKNECARAMLLNSYAN
jgi:hypothetical protein